MLTRMIDDIKDSTGVAIRMTSLAAAIALAFLVTIAFLCAAAFVYVLQNYGPIEACLTGVTFGGSTCSVASGSHGSLTHPAVREASMHAMKRVGGFIGTAMHLLHFGA